VITVVHGGQTGVDRGAHEAALDNGWSVAGFMPRDGRDELGKIPEAVARFLVAHEKTSYAARTEANVRTATAALFVVRDANDPRETPGTAKTLELATERRLRRLIVDPTDDPATIARWIWSDLLMMRTLPLPLLGHPLDPAPTRLLVAGPRESKWQGARVQTAALLRRVSLALAEIGRPPEPGHTPSPARR
jgi:hypothetical protein